MGLKNIYVYIYVCVYIYIYVWPIKKIKKEKSLNVKFASE